MKWECLTLIKRMNLAAYSQIEDLMPVLQSTGIEIPRLRGLGLMKNEEPVSKTDLDEILLSNGSK